ncbi:hypothetical protein E2562_027809 [Oryza meyeriana var. granulata]|uniref:Uncharacterized protein n=1 Tax=Oryza meyeriana var. granulata TaxID=110450 RepID=A0A6G1DRE4_9ORYZ|nr:hypothetical protein E2562_027809 [Oryza meyeriana var. granulata]
MLVGMEGEGMAAASSGCSSGCQSGWTTYLDDHSSYSCGTARFHGKAHQPYYYCDYSEDAEEDDLSMISDASSGPRQQYSTGKDDDAAAHANAAGRRGGRRMEPAARRHQSKLPAGASLLEDTASSPAFFKYTNASVEGKGYGYGGVASPVMEMGNAADFSCAFSATTGFESPLNGIPLGGYRQMQYSTTHVKAIPARQTRRGGVEKKRR